MRYRCILADPPWQQPMTGRYKIRRDRAESLPYPSMTLEQIKRMRVGDLADCGCHLWLWVTNAFLRQGFDVMEAWGFKYLAPITWVKPAGIGNYFSHHTEHILFGYKSKCYFPLARYRPTAQNWGPSKRNRHSEKPEASYEFVESISPGPRLELFARQKRAGWDVWGNEVEADIELSLAVAQ